MLGRQVRRTQHHAPCDPIELDQGECRGELILREQHDATVAQFLEPAAETGGVRELSERDDVADAVEPPVRRAGRVYELPQRVTWQSVRTA